ncbi:multimerin-2-like [Megalobrama amblycephala]|uniref:multimerin-2-like n=1 Tax=Megalobrama amblycephala TaxID=75352 RepID=UPI0020145FC0|nr:multimerin-2-like [Megalobrama amblycephala]
MKALVCILLLLETFVFVVQQQVDGGLNENEISQQISSEDGRQNPPQTDTLRAEASTDSQQYCDLGIPDIHAALRELTATVTEQKGNIRELTATVTEQKGNIRELTATVTEQKGNIRELTATVTEQKEKNRELTATVTEQKENIRALEAQLGEQQTFILDEMNKKNEEISNLTLSQVEELRKENRDREIAFSAGLRESGSGNTGPFTTDITLTYKNIITNIGNAYNPITGVFTAPLKGAYMFRTSVYGYGPTAATADIIKNGEHVVIADAWQNKDGVNSSNGVVLILEVGDVVYVRLRSSKRLYDSQNNHNTFSGYLLFPLG